MCRLVDRYKATRVDENIVASATARLAQLIEAVAGIEHQAYAGWWIDRRDNTAWELLAGSLQKPGRDTSFKTET